jgi:lysophospholipase L1-like esterase
MKTIFATAFFLITAFTLEQKKKMKVWLIGDSTMANKEITAYPETGWGMPFTHFFDSTVEVDNRAKNGRSTKSFMAEGLWKPVVDNLQEGDYVLIQFGHNDEVKTKATYTTEDEFVNNLRQYVNETRMKKAIPVLITPVARRKFDSTGMLEDTHKVYSALVRAVALKDHVSLIDLDQKSQALLKQYGPDASKYLFNYLDAGEHPNYPEGRKDDTHFSELGARRMAEIVLTEIRSIVPGLAGHIVQPVKK